MRSKGGHKARAIIHVQMRMRVGVRNDVTALWSGHVHEQNWNDLAGTSSALERPHWNVDTGTSELERQNWNEA